MMQFLDVCAVNTIVGKCQEIQTAPMHNGDIRRCAAPHSGVLFMWNVCVPLLEDGVLCMPTGSLWRGSDATYLRGDVCLWVGNREIMCKILGMHQC